MTYKFSDKSLERLSGVHPDLQRVFQEAITDSPYDFSITEGVRTLDRQKELFAQGKSKTLRSRHLTGHAVDIAVFVDGKATWDFPKYQAVADHVKSVAKLNDVSITWGGDWISFKDGPHYELNKSVYPDARG